MENSAFAIALAVIAAFGPIIAAFALWIQAKARAIVVDRREVARGEQVEEVKQAATALSEKTDKLLEKTDVIQVQTNGGLTVLCNELREAKLEIEALKVKAAGRKDQDAKE